MICQALGHCWSAVVKHASLSALVKASYLVQSGIEEVKIVAEHHPPRDSQVQQQVLGVGQSLSGLATVVGPIRSVLTFDERRVDGLTRTRHTKGLAQVFRGAKGQFLSSVGHFTASEGLLDRAVDTAVGPHLLRAEAPIQFSVLAAPHLNWLAVAVEQYGFVRCTVVGGHQPRRPVLGSVGEVAN